MRAADDSIGRDDRLSAVIPHELKDLAFRSRICPDIGAMGKPTPKCAGLGSYFANLDRYLPGAPKRSEAIRKHFLPRA
jgi:hypothetical protein